MFSTAFPALVAVCGHPRFQRSGLEKAWTVHGQGAKPRKALSLLPTLLKVASAERALTSGNRKAKSYSIRLWI